LLVLRFYRSTCPFKFLTYFFCLFSALASDLFPRLQIFLFRQNAVARTKAAFFEAMVLHDLPTASGYAARLDLLVEDINKTLPDSLALQAEKIKSLKAQVLTKTVLLSKMKAQEAAQATTISEKPLTPKRHRQSRAKLSPSEKAERQQAGACYYCGKNGHQRVTCTLAPTNPCPPGNPCPPPPPSQQPPSPPPVPRTGTKQSATRQLLTKYFATPPLWRRRPKAEPSSLLFWA